MSLVSDLREFILDRTPWPGSPEELTADFPLIDGGIVNSLTIYEIAKMIEDRYGLEVEDAEIEHSHFQSLQAIADLIESKQED